MEKSGVKLGDRAKIYSSASFGSEPYLIEIGDYVRINAGVKFITHDGGVMPFKDKGDNEKLGQLLTLPPIKRR